MDDNNWLVVWNIWCISIYFSIQLGIVIPTDFHIFQRGWNHQPDLKMMVIRLLADKIIELNGWFSSKPCLMTPECNGYYNLKRCQFSDYFIYLITCFFWGGPIDGDDMWWRKSTLSGPLPATSCPIIAWIRIHVIHLCNLCTYVSSHSVQRLKLVTIWVCLNIDTPQIV